MGMYLPFKKSFFDSQLRFVSGDFSSLHDEKR